MSHTRTPGYKDLRHDERILLALVLAKSRRRITKLLMIARCSEKSFDVVIECRYKSGDHEFDLGARLDLWAIQELTKWTTSELACMTDHPEMAMSGDFSALRDSTEAKRLAIFNRFVKPQIKRYVAKPSLI